MYEVRLDKSTSHFLRRVHATSGCAARASRYDETQGEYEKFRYQRVRLPNGQHRLLSILSPGRHLVEESDWR